MPRETLKQRISYLVEHGGAYPEDKQRDWKSWAVLAMLVMLVAIEAAQLLR